MIVYQIFVDGSSVTFGEHFKMHSKHVFKNEPTQEQIDAFISECADPKYFDYLDLEHKYEVKILKLILED